MKIAKATKGKSEERMKQNPFSKDLYRYYGAEGESLLQRLLRPAELKYLCALRKRQNTHNRILGVLYQYKLLRLSHKTGIQIPHTCSIGEGLYIGHCGTIVVNRRAVLGKNVNLSTGVVIGQENRGSRKGCPVIGDRVWFGSNAVVVGNITIGNDVMIAPNSFVNFNVPDHSIVIGNPAKILPRDNATEDYINRTV